MTKFNRKAVDVLDYLTTNPWTAFPIFILVVYITFWCTFFLGKYPMEWIQNGVDAICDIVSGAVSVPWLKDLLVDGILPGMGGVLVYLPNIIILYLLLSVMESSGYMGRAAFIMDRVMHRMGLHGRSFIPMIMGFGCNVPAIMSCRDIKPKKSRLITALIIPFMSCSGRLPVYLLIVAAFFPDNAPLVLLGIYAVGVVLGVIAAKLLSVTVPGIAGHDHVDIKPYRIPSMRFVCDTTWAQVKEYLQRIAGPILVFSIALWLLGYFPRAGVEATPYQQKEQSLVGHMGRAVEPVLTPIGMNWKDGVAVVAGVGAKELIVSTLGVMYSGDGASLQDALRSSHTAVGALAMMVFILLYLPCVGTFVALHRVLRSWGWTIGSAVMSIIIAWVCAFATYGIFSLLL